jgi:hypothetical protein
MKCFNPFARRVAAILLLAAFFPACARSDADASDRSTVNPANGGDSTGTPAASMPRTLVPDSFSTVNGRRVFGARKAYDLTGDDRPETIVLRAEGSRPDTAQITLLVLATAADTLYRDGWNAQRYFHYEDRGSFSDSAATAKVVDHLRRVLNDSSFSASGPPERMKAGIPDGIDRDAVRYDLKEAAVRARHSIRAGAPLPTALYPELEKEPVAAAVIDSLVAELRTSPTFTYFAGGEVTYTIAWSAAKHRFVRIFSCC